VGLVCGAFTDDSAAIALKYLITTKGGDYSGAVDVVMLGVLWETEECIKVCISSFEIIW
jgi:hypothetical protein